MNKLPLFLALIVILIGGLVLLAWYWQWPAVYTLMPGMPPMVPNTALGLLLMGLALLFLAPLEVIQPARLVGQILAATSALLGVATILIYLKLWPALPRLDEMLASLYPIQPSEFRSSPHTAITFVFAGTALLLIGMRKPIFHHAGVQFALISLIIPFVALFGYLYEQISFYHYVGKTGMALHTAVAFVLLALGLALSRKQYGFMRFVMSNTIGGRLFRRLIPVILLVPMLVGWLTLNFYKSGYFTLDYGFALESIIALFVLATVIGYIARYLDREEEKRMQIQDKLVLSEKNLRDYALHLDKIREDERSKIARDVHDEIGGMLSALKMDISLTTSKLKSLGLYEDMKHRLDNAADHIDYLMQSVRRILTELRPSILDNLGLLDAIEWQLSKHWVTHGIQYNIEQYPDEEQIDFSDSSDISNIFRMFQEITTNIVKHADASMINVSASIVDNHFVLSVNDNGKGMDMTLPAKAGAFGILSIRERTHIMGGECSIYSKQGHGTTVTINLPLRDPCDVET